MLNYLRRLAQNFSHQYILNYLRLQFYRQTPGKGGMGRRVFHHQHNPRSPAFGWRCPCSFANKNFPPRPRAPGCVNDQINWQNHSSGMDIYLTYSHLNVMDEIYPTWFYLTSMLPPDSPTIWHGVFHISCSHTGDSKEPN